MTDISNDITSTIGRRIRSERDLRGWSLGELADRSAVSKAMLSAMERGMTSPTAALLVRVASAFGMTLSTLIARAEMQGGGVSRKDEQPVWRDPATGYVRRHLSPASQMPLELIRVSLPAGARVSFPAASYAFIKQQIWLIGGRLDFTEGDVVHKLEPGDCLALGAPSDCIFHAPGPEAAEYLVALVRG
ncbi:helix-turn-helix domain-containing protein [Mesorhizobium captivum]|uniref:XRE family transcriptional regulator n=1 Tax=Mesorhizobium captivum TaxID=3072319 RepID=A0ABU4Z2W0_9HYPH|nr:MULTISPECIES: XRE family transcriptional regulator [unclassified Mesorhizobium]MDX8493571.1 XRE family transcriptional regulator [Mesorhizobium sp. VK22B]MDX8497552.1 XRE family transcriptional regulator [Mesorhizobium sp. VK4C]MDX8506996.1 XRE family transcriptional regulator [Mesorhizobium sp. VK22E]MDX8511602.1 XRE family transcriptional regulator [Mesorhizobium sp. VK23E]